MMLTHGSLVKVSPSAACEVYPIAPQEAAVLVLCRSRAAAIACWRLSWMPAAKAWSNRSAPSACRIPATIWASPCCCSGQARRPTRWRRPSAAPVSSAARSPPPWTSASCAKAVRHRVTLRVLWVAKLSSSPSSSSARASSGRPLAVAVGQVPHAQLLGNDHRLPTPKATPTAFAGLLSRSPDRVDFAIHNTVFCAHS